MLGTPFVGGAPPQRLLGNLQEVREQEQKEDGKARGRSHKVSEELIRFDLCAGVSFRPSTCACTGESLGTRLCYISTTVDTISIYHLLSLLLPF